MTDFNIRSDSVDVEQIMRQIRSRIREKRGVDYTEDEIHELANVKLEKFLDPRGVGPAMYAPNLAFAVPGGRAIGASEVVPPVAGVLVLFPAWIYHQVRPYAGKATRISIAFNLSI